MCSRKASWLLAAALWSLPAHADDAAGPAPERVPISQASIDSAVTQLKLDPNLSREIRVRKLKWSNSTREDKPAESPKWLTGLFEYMSQFFGVFLWIAGAVAVAFAAVLGFRLLLKRAPRMPGAPVTSIVGETLDLDLRPDSLPADVGAAALELSRQGNIRECLSLLYRAALSRAVNRFGAVVGPALTEREALIAVQSVLDESRTQYLKDLIRVRQRAVYAGEIFAPEDIAPLCAQFDVTMNGVRA